MPYIFCDLPYMLDRFFGENAANSRSESPITGGHFFICLARSYGVLTMCMIATLTRGREKNIAISFLETMQVANLVRGVYVILAEDPVKPVEPDEQVEEPRQRLLEI